MPLKYAVSPRTILLCNYSLGGFKPPEMVKLRPAVVITGRLPRRDGLHTVVPLSGTEADPRNLYQCKIELGKPLPEPFAETTWWVKADMVATVSFERLELFRTARDTQGKRKYLTDLKVSEEQFSLIKEALRHALGLLVDK
jgi:mRNA interferase MazF